MSLRIITVLYRLGQRSSSASVRGIGLPKHGLRLCIWVIGLDEHVAELFELLRTPNFLRK